MQKSLIFEKFGFLIIISKLLRKKKFFSSLEITRNKKKTKCLKFVYKFNSEFNWHHFISFFNTLIKKKNKFVQ